jgi:acetate kinase
MPQRHILVMNAGSSSIKCALFDDDLAEVLRIEATGIGEEGCLTVSGKSHSAALPDNAAALDAVLAALNKAGINLDDLRGVAHRVVHGGQDLTQSVRITPDIRARIQACIGLAPLHNPHHLAAIDALAQRAPELAQYASFDTGFHADNPDVARTYAIPQTPDTHDIRRYGFHGISYASLVRALPDQSGTALPSRLLAFHLGNGGSICAIRDGKSVATTMGYSPTSGLTMGTRSGDIDPIAVLNLARAIGIERTDQMLTRESGLLGLSGLSSDMRTLTTSPAPGAKRAVDHFCYWAARHAGSMIAAMGGLDAIAFTGGIGENSREIRENILDKLAWAGNVPHWIVPAQEERHIAREATDLMETDHLDNA